MLRLVSKRFMKHQWVSHLVTRRIKDIVSLLSQNQCEKLQCTSVYVRGFYCEKKQKEEAVCRITRFPVWMWQQQQVWSSWLTYLTCIRLSVMFPWQLKLQLAKLVLKLQSFGKRLKPHECAKIWAEGHGQPLGADVVHFLSLCGCKPQVPGCVHTALTPL